MGTFVFNISKGRVAELYNRVDSNDPSNSVLVIVAVNRGADTDPTMKDRADLAALLGGTTDEVTNGGYARKILTDTDLLALAVDNAGDTMPCGLPGQTWAGVAAGSAWTDLIICYDNDSTSGSDSNIIPLTCHTFAVTPDGTDIVAQITNFYVAS